MCGVILYSKYVKLFSKNLCNVNKSTLSELFEKNSFSCLLFIKQFFVYMILKVYHIQQTFWDWFICLYYLLCFFNNYWCMPRWMKFTWFKIKHNLICLFILVNPNYTKKDYFASISFILLLQKAYTWQYQKWLIEIEMRHFLLFFVTL